MGVATVGDNHNGLVYQHNFLEDEIAGVDEIKAVSLDTLCDILVSRYRMVSAVTGYNFIDLARASFVDATLSVCWTLNSDGTAENGIQLVKATYEVLHSQQPGRIL